MSNTFLLIEYLWRLGLIFLFPYLNHHDCYTTYQGILFILLRDLFLLFQLCSFCNSHDTTSWEREAFLFFDFQKLRVSLVLIFFQIYRGCHFHNQNTTEWRNSSIFMITILLILQWCSQIYSCNSSSWVEENFLSITYLQQLSLLFFPVL